nr:hypothetical protein GCM10025730_50570 [Promicromonospora thailandica]
MHDPLGVRGGQGGQDHVEDREGAAQRELALADQVPQVRARHVLHGQVTHGAVGALVVHRDDAVVLEPGRRARLALEPLQEARRLVALGEVRVHHLEGDLAVQAGVVRTVDRGHPAARHARHDPVPAVDQTADERVCRHLSHGWECTGDHPQAERNAHSGRCAVAGSLPDDHPALVA